MDLGAFGCDSYDISGTVDGGGSKGALHGVTTFNMDYNVPSSQFSQNMQLGHKRQSYSLKMFLWHVFSTECPCYVRTTNQDCYTTLKEEVIEDSR